MGRHGGRWAGRGVSQPWRRGAVVWADLDPTVGRQQGGRRPAVVVASDDYLAVVDTLTIVVPVTSRDRGWPNHVQLHGPVGLDRSSWAMTEQPRTISRGRIHRLAGTVDRTTLDRIDLLLRDFLAL